MKPRRLLLGALAAFGAVAVGCIGPSAGDVEPEEGFGFRGLFTREATEEPTDGRRVGTRPFVFFK